MNHPMRAAFVLCLSLLLSVAIGLSNAQTQARGPVPVSVPSPAPSTNADNIGRVNTNPPVSTSSPSPIEHLPSIQTVSPSDESARIQEMLRESEQMSAQRLAQQQMETTTIQHMQQVQQQQMYYWQQQQAVMAAAQHAQQQLQQQQQQQQREASSSVDSVSSRPVDAVPNPNANQQPQPQLRPQSQLSADDYSRLNSNRASSFATFAAEEDMDYSDDSSSLPIEFVSPIAVSARPRVSAYNFAKADVSNGNPPPASSTNNNNWRTQCQHQCTERLMDVTGVGVTSITPDKAEVRATVEYRVTVNTSQSQGVLEPKAMNQLISQVQNEVSSRAAAVVQYLKQNEQISSHISKLHTTGLSLEPLYEYVNNHMLLSGYRASNSITFRVDVAQAGEAVDSIVKQGVTRIDGVSFISSPKELAAARQVAIANAVEDGLQQAVSAMSGAGRLTGSWKSDLQIVTVNIVAVTRPEPDNMSSLGYHRAMPAAAPIMRMEKLDSSTTPIEGEERTISAAVLLKLRF